MSKRAVLVSDLHLSTNASLDDFTRDEDFEDLLAVPELEPGPDGVDLVLLGDTFDLWQSVSDAECEASKAKLIDLSYGPTSEVRRLAEVRARHPRWFEALGSWARLPGARVVLVPGNHDHGLVMPEVQAALAGHLGLPAGSPQLAFQSWYEDARLALYADHGSQYDDDNQVADFSAVDWRADSAGYYFVKLFFNRVEHRDPRIENAPGGWSGVWHWLRRVANLPLLAAALRWFWQYWTDGRVPRRIGLVRAAVLAPAPPSAVAPPSAPTLLVGQNGTRGRANFFCDDPVMEEFFRDAYQRSAEVRVAVNEILDARGGPARGAGRRRALAGGRAVKGKAAGKTAAARRAALARRRPEVPRPMGTPGAKAARTRGLLGGSSDVDAAERLFSDKPYFRAQLSRADFEFVVLGHTHGELTRKLSNGATYLNTGTWTLAAAPLPVVFAQAEGAPSARLLHLANGALA